MTSEIDVSKTNEFLRRRKIRLQQVREQSKDIAKKIRQRAKVEKLRHVITLDAKKEKEYFDLQGKLVDRLEKLYSESLQNVGSGHKNAAKSVETGNETKRDLSKLRGKEAVAELRKRKQEQLDEKKKLLDRKLQAREAANELSREKQVTITKVLASKSSENILTAVDNLDTNKQIEGEKITSNLDTTKNDMGTQWEGDVLSNESCSRVPKLSLPQDDKDSEKHLDCEKEKSDSKRMNLFALSDEMPSSLRGGSTSIPTQVPQQKSSVTLVSEYLQTRSLRLREADPVIPKKNDDLQSIKQTILRSRTSRTDVSGNSEKSKNVNNHSSVKKNSVTMYNHSTRDTRNINCNSEQLVIREQNKADDAYNKALKECTSFGIDDNIQLEKKREEMRTKVAVAREKVDKDYKDTLAFLNSISKDQLSGPCNPKAFMDQDRQQLQQERHQKKLEDEFKKIERESHKHTCKHKTRSLSTNKGRSKSRSPEYVRMPQNFLYDWMPVPNNDEGYVHNHNTTPNKQIPKNNNSVKFNDVDTYHEYRSRHKHTPPTKDVPLNKEKQRVVETLVIEQNSSENSDSSSITSDSSLAENIKVQKNRTDKEFLNDPRLSDGDRIVIYKILDSKKGKRCKDHKSQNITPKSNDRKAKLEENIQKTQQCDITDQRGLENLQEGIYKVGENGVYNIMSCYMGNVEMWKTFTERRPWWDNIAAMYYPANNQNMTTERKETCQKSSVRQRGIEAQHSKSSHSTSFRCEHLCFGCKCPKINHPHTTSAATSTSSFQTATNDKGVNLLADGGFVKVIDEGELDAGKFYVGASGFLKDDNYEVVIQLKKKDNDKFESKAQDVFENKPEDEPSSTQKLSKVDIEIQSSIINNLKESAAQTSIIHESEPLSTKSVPVKHLDVQDFENIAPNDNKVQKDLGDEPKIFLDKNVYTTFEDIYAIPDEVPKIDRPIGPATSTYTQTSFSSPNSKPVFMHMTSSTSTAYMSPPDFILPRFLRNNHVLHPEENLTTNYCSESNPPLKNKCPCSKRKHKCKKIQSPTDTPPNTAQSNNYNSSVSEETQNKYSRRRQKLCHRTHKYKTVEKCSPKYSHSIEPLNCKYPESKSNLQKLRTLNKTNKTGFNPIVKEYVNKLLTLNKEGLRAIQVINQDCSSVDTPKSSIINANHNIKKTDKTLENKISLEQIKIMLEQKIVRDYAKRVVSNREYEMGTQRKNKLSRKKQVHKVKSLNISKNLLKKQASASNDLKAKLHYTTKVQSSSSSSQNALLLTQEANNMISANSQNRSKTSPTPKSITEDSQNTRPYKRTFTPKKQISEHSSKGMQDNRRKMQHKNSTSSDSSSNQKQQRCYSHIPPTDISTQTSGIDSEINFMKLAENKLQNMEKIADLTEKCTKRLSNLAKVLEEVRKNKSLAYSHISTSDNTSDSEPKIYVSDMKQIPSNEKSYQMNAQINQFNLPHDDPHYTPLLKDIPKPTTPLTLSLSTISEKSHIPTSTSSTDKIKPKPKPPPALSRINLKNGENNLIIPHELSTVMEVDSPMSIKIKNQSSQKDVRSEAQSINVTNEENKSLHERQNIQMDIQPENGEKVLRESSTSSNDAKMEMMDMKLFNDIMLKPFISLHEYAKQREILVDDASNVDAFVKDDQVCEEISSLHSEGSLPDVISELLKRKIISEPFRFDTATSMSSESSLSLIALSKMYNEKKVGRHVVKKENTGETSETLSISSNPDLENAFQKLGMGWASSTLKKTKERLALSSSSNTSGSSYNQLKLKSFNKEPPTTGLDSTLSDVQNVKKKHSRNMTDFAKNAVQQTSLTNSMTVKEFLTNELAKKITFTNKSGQKSDEEFVSLYETKMPAEIKQTPEKVVYDESIESQMNNRAKTSTPVQVFKSTTYHTSSSNTSNGLFSNADELSSVKMTSTSIRNHSTSEKDDLTIPNYSLKRKGLSDKSKSD